MLSHPARRHPSWSEAPRLRLLVSAFVAVLLLTAGGTSSFGQSPTEPPEPVWGRGGFVPVFGGLGPTAGLTAGVRYDLFLRHPRLTLAGDLLGSTRLYAGGRLLGGFENDHAAIYTFGRYRYLPRESFYGFGPDTDRGNIGEYRLDEWTAGMSAGFTPSPSTFIGGHVTYRLHVLRDADLGDVAPDGWTDGAPPVVQTDATYLIAGGWFEVDRRELPRDRRSGYRFAPVSPSLTGLALGVTRGWYFSAEAVPHVSVGANDPFFVRFDVDAQLFFPLRYEMDGVALRTHYAGTATGDDAPAFYTLPALGGSNSIRGFRPNRFRDRHALHLNAEYRRSLLLFLDAAFFADVGQVFAEPSQITLSHLEAGYGLGLRARIGRWVLGRIDVAHSREGFQVYLRAGSFL